MNPPATENPRGSSARQRPVDHFRWDDRSHQPHRIRKLDRYVQYARSIPAHAELLGVWLRTLPGALVRYRRRLGELYPVPRRLPPGFGIGVEVRQESPTRLIEEIGELGARCVLVRMPVWDLSLLGPCRDLMEGLNALGVPTSVAVLQDRRHMLDPSAWKQGLDRIFGTLGPLSEAFEIGHAWNRLKWGVLTFREYLALFRSARAVREKHPQVRLAGPAVIDFEYYYAAGALLTRKDPAVFDVLTSLLYVDRRGAPENPQYGHFDLGRKIALLRAYADLSASRGAPLWITETNWPLSVAGGYAPTSMKEAVSEEIQADFLVRYYVAALASGFVDRVYWWQLIARGYGLIDDTDGSSRRRPAWHAFRTLASLLGRANLVKAVMKPDHRAFTFESDDRLITAAWATDRSAAFSPERTVTEVLSRDGARLPSPPAVPLPLSRSPVFLVSPL